MELKIVRGIMDSRQEACALGGGGGGGGENTYRMTVIAEENSTVLRIR